MILSALLFFSQDLNSTRMVTQGLAIGGVGLGGRRPIPQDAIVDQIAEGKWKPPKAGLSITYGGRERTWKEVKAKADGSFDGVGTGYLWSEIVADKPETAILNVRGDTLVYVNGEPRAGDPYSTGDLNLPVQLRQGSNELLIYGGRGGVKASVTEMTKPVALQTGDATLPDLLTTDRRPLWASIIAINGTTTSLEGCRIRATLTDGTSLDSKSQSIPSMSIRKEAFLIPVPRRPLPGDVPVTISLTKNGRTLDSAKLTLTVRKPSEIYKRTFLSGIDGSVQYYAVNPAAKPSDSNALVLTLHGAGVEAIGQARAYGQKDWATVVAATNRRPYGFDWEDIGREDALEVLGEAERQIPHDPERVDLVGHSMGGHGTWSIGTLYPNLFASMAPSAGWISFWSYAGAWTPTNPTATEALLRRSMNVSDTFGRVRNTLAEDVYILHGAADDNVPVTEARAGRAELTRLEHPNLEYHEQPGAGHWWGNQCVDWPPLFEMVKRAKLDPNPRTIDFTTQNPAVSSEMGWLTIDQQIQALTPSRAVATRRLDGVGVDIRTENVARLSLRALPSACRVSLDGQILSLDSGGDAVFDRRGARWELGNSRKTGEKSPLRSGPFKQVFARRFMFVVGTTGTPEENLWSEEAARFQAETMLYRGNGAVDIVRDKDYSSSRFRGRNVVIFGNSDTNSAWKSLLGASPVQFKRGAAIVGKKSFSSDNLSGLLVAPNPHDSDGLVAAVTGTGLAGFKRTDRLPIFSSGVAYPDWIVMSPNSPGGILADGFFGNDWTLEHGESAFAPQ